MCFCNDDAVRANSHAGMEVTITNSKGNILAHGYGGQDLNFTVDSKETFSVSVQYSGTAMKNVGSDINVDMLYSKTK